MSAAASRSGHAGAASRGAVAVIAALVAGVAIGIYARPAIVPRHGSGDEPPAGRAAPRQLWTCGMHPQVLQEEPGFCPICGMALTPLRTDPAAAEDEGTGAVVIDPVVVQNMGVRVATVEEGPLRRTVRAVGILEEAEPNRHDVSLRVSGWIERLHADTEGMHLRRGAPLLDLYSPDLQVAAEELIAARRARDALPSGAAPARAAAEALYRSAERKLELWGVDAREIARVARLERAPRTITFTSPIDGHLVEKPVVEGSAVQAGERILRIVDHGILWLDAQIFERDLPFVRVGQPATASIAAMPGEAFGGEVTFIHPHVDETARTAMARVAVANPGLLLRPGTYATVLIETERAAHATLVPREAVIDTGVRQVVFVPLEGGRFEPREVRLGAAGEGGLVQVLEGLAPGERVVVSGQFLLDAESRFQEAVQKHRRERLLMPGGERVDGAPEERPHAH
jgi:Cu(I)/Ag(I) efflux system membrane fusion protein